jgi:hypothetical protein
MKIDALKQYAKLRQQLMEEQSELQTRLNEINQVLGTETAPASPPTTTPPAEAESPVPVAQVKRRGRRAGKMSMREAITQALSERGPLSRGELGQAVVDLGYKSHAKNPLGSLGILLYSKNSPFKKKDGKFYLPGGAAVETPVNEGNGEAPAKKRKFTRSAAARARMAEAQRASWARRRKGK